MSIKITLAAARVNAGLKQGEAAEKIGVMPQTLRNWEKGKTAPKIAQVNKMCTLYGIPSDVLFFGE